MSLQQTFESSWLRDEITARGFAEFEHGIDPEDIELLVHRYADFTHAHPDPLPSTMDAMLPETPEPFKPDDFPLDDLDRSQDSQGQWHKYRTNTPQVGKPDGYTNRSFQVQALKQARGIVLDDDPKEYYHHTPRHYGNMARQHKLLDWGPIPTEVAALDTAFAKIHHKASGLITRVCALIEEVHPEINDFITKKSLLGSPVRLLFYHPSDSDQLGAGHYDKGALTLQLAESHEGLRVAPDSDALLEPVVHDADNAVFFPATMLSKTFGKDTPFQPGWHDIIRVNRLNQGRNVPPQAIEVCARWALIFFANGVNYSDPGKAATHNR